MSAARSASWAIRATLGHDARGNEELRAGIDARACRSVIEHRAGADQPVGPPRKPLDQPNGVGGRQRDLEGPKTRLGETIDRALGVRARCEPEDGHDALRDEAVADLGGGHDGAGDRCTSIVASAALVLKGGEKRGE